MKWAEAADDQDDQPGQQQVDVSLLHLADRPDRAATCRSTRWCASCSRPPAARSRIRPPTYFQVERDTLKTAENVAQVFLRHSHAVRPVPQPSVRPLDDGRLLQLRRVLRPGRPQAGRRLSRGRRVRPRRRRSAASGWRARRCRRNSWAARRPTIPPARTAARSLAEWLTSPENPFFATSVANRIWAHFFGAGIVEPVDDIRVSNPPSNPELFQKLGAKLAEYNYDFKSLVRDICNSEAYQRSSERNESNAADERNFAHAIGPPHPGRAAARLHRPGDRDARQVPGSAARRPGRADRRRHARATTS